MHADAVQPFRAAGEPVQGALSDELAVQLREFIASEPALAQLLAAARDRYETLGRVGGNVALNDAAAVAAARLLLSRKPRGRSVALAELDAAFLDSRWHCTLLEALTAWFGTSPVPRAARRDAEDVAWSAALATITSPPGQGNWTASVISLLRSDWRSAPEKTIMAARLVALAMAQLPSAVQVPLAVFATSIAGDPHAFDRQTIAGRYLLRALASLFPELECAPPFNAADREMLLAAAGIAVDDVSSSVTVANLCGDDPMLTAAGPRAWAIPLGEIDSLGAVRTTDGVAFVVENPSVFRLLVQAAAAMPPEQRPTIVCTSGQLSLAALRLLERLTTGGAEIRYAGDFDVSGLVIARGLRTRFGPRCVLWRMSGRDYSGARASQAGEDVLLHQGRIAALAQDFPELAPLMAERGAVYQESIAAVLRADILAHARAAHARSNPEVAARSGGA